MEIQFHAKLSECVRGSELISGAGPKAKWRSCNGEGCRFTHHKRATRARSPPPWGGAWRHKLEFRLWNSRLSSRAHLKDLNFVGRPTPKVLSPSAYMYRPKRFSVGSSRLGVTKCIGVTVFYAVFLIFLRFPEKGNIIYSVFITYNSCCVSHFNFSLFYHLSLLFFCTGSFFLLFSLPFWYFHFFFKICCSLLSLSLVLFLIIYSLFFDVCFSLLPSGFHNTIS